MSAGGRNRELVIQQRSATQDSDTGAYTYSWSDLATVFAEVLDTLPSRAEDTMDGLDMANRPCRVRMLFRDDVTSAMRFKLPSRDGNEADRILNIISGPAELGFRERMEFMCENWTTQGSEP